MHFKTNSNVVVDTQWLSDHLHNPNVRIVEVEMAPDHYKEAHIPGAVFWNIMTDLVLPDLRQNLDINHIEQLLSRSSITNEMTVVAYGSYPGTGAWIFWLLKLFGHTDVRVLDGGHQKWLAEGRPVTTEFSTFAPVEYQARPLDTNLRVLADEVRTAIDRPDQVILDVRTLQEYQGEYFLMKPPEGTEQAGHIPGAIHLEHTLTLNEDGTFKSIGELQELLTSKGMTSDKEVFPYCAIGGRSAYIWFVLKYVLGYPNVRNYDGSWNEWSRLPDALIEK
ncbi:sulfurtransferase [Pantanalinema sp. GBBB05]|uniref:sulfurtransferase n=1 Tax=Pantanalinema sp. GBBB05 TaxID=2604139 RepID=UPI001D1E1E58|nr:sulfurtransferase [Pantanalinema sp. GBBB05]